MPRDRSSFADDVREHGNLPPPAAAHSPQLHVKNLRGDHNSRCHAMRGSDTAFGWEYRLLHCMTRLSTGQSKTLEITQLCRDLKYALGARTSHCLAEKKVDGPVGGPSCGGTTMRRLPPTRMLFTPSSKPAPPPLIVTEKLRRAADLVEEMCDLCARFNSHTLPSTSGADLANTMHR